MEKKITVLFICGHNSGRSQIAEAYLKHAAGSRFEVESAGMKPHEKINPLVVEVMKEEGMDLSNKVPQSVFDKFKAGRLYDHVVALCDEAESQCPIFPGITKRWYWPFDDPAAVTGTPEEKLDQVRKIRDSIKDWLLKPGKEGYSFRKLIE